MGELFVGPVRTDGSVTIPQAVRRAHDAETGDDVLVELHGVKTKAGVEPPEVPEDQADLSGFEWGDEETEPSRWDTERKYEDGGDDGDE